MHGCWSGSQPWNRKAIRVYQLWVECPFNPWVDEPAVAPIYPHSGEHILGSRSREAISDYPSEAIMIGYEKPALVKVGSFKETTNATRRGKWYDFILGYYWY